MVWTMSDSSSPEVEGLLIRLGGLGGFRERGEWFGLGSGIGGIRGRRVLLLADTSVTTSDRLSYSSGFGGSSSTGTSSSTSSYTSSYSISDSAAAARSSLLLS